MSSVLIVLAKHLSELVEDIIIWFIELFWIVGLSLEFVLTSDFRGCCFKCCGSVCLHAHGYEPDPSNKHAEKDQSCNYGLGVGRHEASTGVIDLGLATVVFPCGSDVSDDLVRV